MKYISLYELNNYLSRQIRNLMPYSIWVTAEVSSINRNSSGHCYLELVEKSETTDSIVARQRGVIWSSKFADIHNRFVQVTQTELKAGISILFCCDVQFHELYGLSLNIIDIDPVFTMGDLQRRKLEIIKRLTDEGLLKLNSLLPMPVVPKNIAVISSNTAAGYADFMHQLYDNGYGFEYKVTLFRSSMQGDKTEEELLGALSAVSARAADFDLVVIIRGGGSVTDLQVFDNEALARKIATFPLPVIVGIGHLRDSSILDLVSARSVKTPTAAAEFIVGISLNALNNLVSLENRLSVSVNDRIRAEIVSVENLSHSIVASSGKFLVSQESAIAEYQRLLQRIVNTYIDGAMAKVDLLKVKVDLLNPFTLLAKGYTFTVQRGKIVTSALDIDMNVPMKSVFFDGEVESRPYNVIDKK